MTYSKRCIYMVFERRIGSRPVKWCSGRSPRPKDTDVLGSQEPTPDLSKIIELYTRLFIFYPIWVSITENVLTTNMAIE